MTTESTKLTREPVRIAWVLYTLVQTIVIVLSTAGAISHTVGTVVTGIALAIHAAVAELFVRQNTVPLKPLQELAQAEQERHP